jgi:MFS family permease
VITNSPKWGLFSAKSIIASAVAVFSFFSLIYYETNRKYPLIDLGLFKIRLFALPVLSASMVFAALFTMVFLMPFYLMLPGGLSEKQAGFVMVIPFMMLFVVSPFSGYISDKTGSRILCSIGMLMLSVALFSLASIDGSSSVWSFAWPLALAGVGTALFLPPNTATALSAVAAEKRGVSSGIIAAARNFGMVTGVALAGTIFNYKFAILSEGASLSAYTKDLQEPFMLSFKAAISAGGWTAALGMIIAFLRGPEKKAGDQSGLQK